MKKLFKIMLVCCAFVLALGLAACGGSSSSSSATASSASASASSEDSSSAAASTSSAAAEEKFFYSGMDMDELQFAVEAQELGEVDWATEVWIVNSGDAAPSFQWQVVTKDSKVYFIGNSGVAKEATDLTGVNTLTEMKAIELVEAQGKGKAIVADLSQDKDGVFYWVVTLKADDANGALSMYNVDPQGNVTGPMTD